MTEEENETVTYSRPKDEGEVDRRRFAGIMGVAGTVAMIALISFFSIGMVGAALGVGIGGFVADFENVNYNDTTVGGTADAAIDPVLGTQAACQNAPQIEASLSGTAELTGNVSFFKDLPLPGVFNTNQMARVGIVAQSGGSPIQADDLDLRLTALEADSLSLSNATIQEFGPGDYNATGNTSARASYAPSGQGSSAFDTTANPEQTPEFGIDARNFSVTNGVAAAHQVSLSSISLSNLDLYVAIDEKADFGGGTGPGPVERVVEPDNRTCSALAAASAPDLNSVN